MITESTIYWVLKLDDIQSAFIPVYILTGIMIITSGLLWIICSFDGDDTENRIALKAEKWFIGSMVCLFFAVIAATLIPSTKQMAMIKVIPMLANSEIVGEMSTDAKELYRMGINAIKEQLTGKEQGK